jgi:hypothetical protein
MSRSRFLISFVFLVCFLLAVSAGQGVNQEQRRGERPRRPGSPPTGVPPQYQRIYARLETVLDRWTKELDQRWNGTLYNMFIPMASVLFANSNAGFPILRKENRDHTKLFIQRLKELGCRGVQLDIQFPTLDPAYFVFAKDKGLIPKDSPDDKAFLEFYKKVAEDVRSQGLKLSVESQVVFIQKTWSPLPVEPYYAEFEKNGEEGFAAYKQRKLAMAKLIAAELRPDFFTMEDEPDTAMSLTGIQLLKKRENYLGMVKELVDGVKPLVRNTTKIASGIGIWMSDWEAWLKDLLKLDIDFINLHIYPIEINAYNSRDDIVPRTLEAADMTHQAGKGIAVGETWLYKTMPLDTKDPEVIYGRDYYDFWIPLDIEHLRLILKIAHFKKFEYISPFWSSFFFSYLNAQEARGLNTAELKRRNNLKVLQNLLTGTFSPTGRSYRDMATGGPGR